MTPQNYQNHRQSDRGWLTAFLILFIITILALWGVGLDIAYYIQEGIMEDTLSYVTNIFLTFAPLLFAWILLLKLRGYATKLQDRIIRQEVNFRHYMITWKTLDPALTTKQIVALRFAGDNEFVALCAKAAQEWLDNKQIKQLITDWKGDYERV